MTKYELPLYEQPKPEPPDHFPRTVTAKSVMWFGKHRGKPLGSIDQQYLYWLWDTLEDDPNISDLKPENYSSYSPLKQKQLCLLQYLRDTL